MSASGAEERSSSLRGGTGNRPRLGGFFILKSLFTDKIIPVKNKLFIYLLIMAIGLSSCINIETQAPKISLPDFITATLPSTPTPPATNTPLPPTPVPTISPIDGTTTTQVNVRVDTSTASENLGTIDQFTVVQVIGKDSTENWYKLIFPSSPNGAGWVRAEYVRVNSIDEIPVIESSISGDLDTSGIVTQRINVRNGPGEVYNSIGVLNPKDIVTMIGRNSDTSWIQIIFTDGTGWLSAQYLENADFESLPVTDTSIEEIATETIDELPAIKVDMSLNDGDTRETPLADIVLGDTGSRAFKLDGTLSNSAGDVEDWIKFSSGTESITINLVCNMDNLKIEIWDVSGIIENFNFKCGEIRSIQVQQDSTYWLRIANLTENANPITYSLGIKAEK